MTKIFNYGSMTLGLGCLAAGWARAGYWMAGIAFLVLIPVGLYLIYRRFAPTPGLMLLLTVLAAATGLWAGIELSLGLAAVILVLAAWDLSNFSARLAFASPQDDAPGIERQHLWQLSLVILISLGLDLLSQSVHHAFGFEWTLLLAVLAFTGIGALMSGMRSEQG